MVIASVFAPIDFYYHQEEQVAAIIAEELPKVRTVCSKYVANIGILERENASILNAALLRYARKTVRSFQSAAVDLKLMCPVFSESVGYTSVSILTCHAVTGNDGTLLTCEQAAKLPIKTFSSGPSNSMRGAAFLAATEGNARNGESAIVADIGGYVCTLLLSHPLSSDFYEGLQQKSECCYLLVSRDKVDIAYPRLCTY